MQAIIIKSVACLCKSFIGEIRSQVDPKVVLLCQNKKENLWFASTDQVIYHTEKQELVTVAA